MELRVGLRKTSLVDYPGRVAATLFFPACNLRCPWCHNRELVTPDHPKQADDGLVDLGEAISLVQKRFALLGGVVLSGGEPTIRWELPEVIARLKASGISVKLDTNGINPTALADLFENDATRPDYVALDLKLAPDRYIELVSPVADHGERERVACGLATAIKRSAALLTSSGVAHEFRSLALGDSFFSESDVAALSPLVDDAPWYFAPFRPGNCLDESWDDHPAARAADAQRLAALARKHGKRGEVRSG